MQQQPQERLQAWAQSVNQETIYGMAGATYSVILARTPLIEKFAVWLLGGTAATAGLTVANVAAVTDSVGRAGVTWLLYSAIASILFGLLSRTVSALVVVDAESLQTMHSKLAAVLAVHEEKRQEIAKVSASFGLPPPDSYQVADYQREVMSGMPALMRAYGMWRLRKLTEGGRRLVEFHLALRGWLWMVELCVLQVIAALVALISVAYHVAAR